jgi:hypothetical protein
MTSTTQSYITAVQQHHQTVRSDSVTTHTVSTGPVRYVNHRCVSGSLVGLLIAGLVIPGPSAAGTHDSGGAIGGVSAPAQEIISEDVRYEQDSRPHRGIEYATGKARHANTDQFGSRGTNGVRIRGIPDAACGAAAGWTAPATHGRPDMSVSNQSIRFDGDEVIKALKFFLDPDEVTEIRILNAVTDDRRQPHTISGYFDGEHFAIVPAELMKLKSASGLYFIPSAVPKELLARSANRLKSADKGGTTTDADMRHRYWLLVDLDPVRPAGISSTDEEHQAAEELARTMRDALRAEGWPDPVLADSGNGFHLVYGLCLDAKDSGLVERVLKALARRFSTDQVKVDTTTHNPARIWKLYGTWSAKGDSTPERPHRMSRMVEAPTCKEYVPEEALDALVAKWLPANPNADVPRGTRRDAAFDLDAWISEHDLVNRFGLGDWEVWRTSDGVEAKRRIFKTCPWDPAHTNGSAVLLRLPDGAIAAMCQHAGCVDRDWHSLRDVVEPGWRENRQAEGEAAARPRAADVLIGLALGQNIELFHSPGADGDAYASIPMNDHVENYPIAGKRFKRWLGRLYYKETGSSPTTQAVDDALGVLQGRALYDGAEHVVAVRIADHDGKIVIDLGDPTWQAVVVGPDGWKVVRSPVKFIRPRGLLAMPEPRHGGSVNEWRDLVNVPGDDDWALLVTCVVAMFRPGRPFPIMCINGEQGSAKSSLCRQIRALVDPNTAPLRAEPREVRDVVIAGKNAWLQAFDNLSHLPAWLSDAFCRMSTGGGFATRQLYEDDAEIVFDVMRPVLLNGIDEVSTRSDLLDRMVTISLPTIAEDHRRLEAEVNAEFERLRPRILGALLDGLSGALRNLPTVKVDRLPRMADFALLGAAAEPALGLPAGSFLAAYRANRQGVHDVALDASPIVPALLCLMEGQGSWSGVSRQLLQHLESDENSDERQRRSRSWPQNARQLTSMLKRIVPNLRAKGLSVSFGRHGHEGVPITIEWTDGSQHAPRVVAQQPTACSTTASASLMVAPMPAVEASAGTHLSVQELLARLRGSYAPEAAAATATPGSVA